MAIAQELLDQIGTLDEAQQKRVLEFVHTLKPTTISGDELIRRAHEINFDSESLKEMMDAVDEWCERIEPDEPNLFT